jgi:hypothetical protein
MKNNRNEIEAMGVIVNIQMMQEKVNGKSWEYKQFKNYDIEQLRNLQDKMIVEYNNTFKPL